MSYYLKIYKAILKINLSLMTSYRGNFINGVLSSLMWGVFQMATILILTSNIHEIFGWSRQDLIILAAAYNVFSGIYSMFISRNFERLSKLTDTGQLDFILLKPVDSQFITSISIINFPAFFRIIFGLCLIAYLTVINHIYLSVFSVFQFIFLILAGSFLAYCVWFFIITLTIWYPQLSNLTEFINTGNSLARYPKEIYNQLTSTIFLLILPLSLIVATPTKSLLNKNFSIDSVEILIFTLVFFIFSRFFWKFALKYYTSASS